MGWKFIYLAVNAGELFQTGMPQRHLFSLEGSPVLGLVLAVLFAGWRYWEAQKSGVKLINKTVEVPGSLDVVGIFTAASSVVIAGAMLFHLLEYPEEMVRFFREPSLQNFLGGLTIYGGLIVGGLTVYLYARRNNLKFLPLADATAPGLMLAYGIGRIGCQVSGDGDWGIPNPHPLSLIHI